MVKKDKEYQPVQVWDRKLVRSVLRNQIIKKDGYHKVNYKMSNIFKEMQRREENQS